MYKLVFICCCIFSFFLLIYSSIRTDPSVKWPDPIENSIKIHIHYTVHFSCINSKVLDAIKEIEDNTCFNFEIVDRELSVEEGIIVFWGDICASSFIGKRSDKLPNSILINDYCCGNSVYVQGLILQALGLEYEHNRFDRETFVHIHKNNIQEIGLQYFNIENTNDSKTYSTNYDYGSITHGWPSMFTKYYYGQTITVKGKHSEIYQKMIGQRRSLSFNEYKLINHYYCNQACINKGIPPCQNDGYQHPNYCYKCQCPYPYEGDYCNYIPAKHPRCPDYKVQPKVHETELKFWNNQNCYTFIQGAADKLILIKITQAHLNYEGTCARGDGTLEIKYKRDKTLMGLCFCGYVRNYEIISENSLAIIIYRGVNEAQYAYLTYKIYENRRLGR
uniref:Metalloendopeptidase n=1 Tax=Parastrongyloides trichosuri TaxID=131310 RepID=A0A0N4Z5P5_PARTI